jgi:hypothetical protein
LVPPPQAETATRTAVMLMNSSTRTTLDLSIADLPGLWGLKDFDPD